MKKRHFLKVVCPVCGEEGVIDYSRQSEDYGSLAVDAKGLIYYQPSDWPEGTSEFTYECGHPVLDKDGKMVHDIDDLAALLELQKLVTDIEDEKLKKFFGQ